MTNLISLKTGTELVGDYRIERVLGAGGFGITYLADEIALDRHVTIKEYFPSDFAARSDGRDAVPKSQECSGDYKWGLERFIEEAQTLARFDHPNIVRVYRYFRANNTGYMVLQFEEGQSLKSWLKGLKRAPRQKELDSIVPSLLDALELIHKADFLHRDIAPDNIIIRRDGQPVLIDFGSARGEIASHSKTVSALVKPGYSPYEQYAEKSSQQGPWTDIYALAATLYHAITGKRPPDAPSRVVKDELVPAREAAVGAYRKGFLSAIDNALKLPVAARPQSIAAWRGDLLAPDSARPGWLSRTLPGNRAVSSSAASEPVKKLAAAEQAGVQPKLPPPPDAPGPKGGLLDFLENLRPKSNGSKARAAAPIEPATPAAARKAEAQPAPAAPTENLKSSPNPVKLKRKERRKATARRAVPVPKPPRPRPVRARKRQSLRPVLFKLLVGVGVASGAVAMQDKLPKLKSQDAGLTTSSLQPKARAAQNEARDASRHLDRELAGHRGGTSAVAYSGDGSLLVTVGKDAALKVWDSGTGRLVRSLQLNGGPATALDVLGSRALTGHRNGEVVLWNIEHGQKIATFKRNDAEIWSVTFAGRPDRFAASSHDWTVALWDTRATSAPLHVFEGHTSAAQAVAYSSSPRGSFIASGSADKTVRLWDLDGFELKRTYRGHRDFVTAIAFSPDGRYMASASLDGNIRVWSTRSRRLFRSLRAHDGRIGDIAFAPAGATLASAGEDGKVRLWDVRQRRGITTLTQNAGHVTTLDFSPAGDHLVSAGLEGSVRIWSTPSVQAAN